ncbi:hypothetical protein EV401DRAFT_2216600, partial [Pisolithus croceorrhizus]
MTRNVFSIEAWYYCAATPVEEAGDHLKCSNKTIDEDHCLVLPRTRPSRIEVVVRPHFDLLKCNKLSSNEVAKAFHPIALLRDNKARR